MALQVWFSIQSDFGITLGELGKLASETDSKLIASTLQALKDIVSIEASSGESQFMTGAVETSSFGTFAISSGKDTKLVMSYIISVPPNETVPENLETIIQKLCTNFGKQLTQITNINKLAKDGARIPNEFLYQAFLNSVTLVQLDTNYKSNRKQLNKDIDLLINEILNSEEKLTENINNILNQEFIQNNDLWNGGFLSNLGRYNFITQLSNELLKNLMEINPIAFLNSEKPRMEYKNVADLLENRFNEEKINLEQRLTEEFEKLDKSDYEEYVSSLSIFQLHYGQDLLYKEFLKRNLIEIAKIQPSVFFKNPSKARVRAIVSSQIPDIKIPNFGDIMIETVTNYAPPHTWNLISTYYQTLVKEMLGKDFSVSAVDMGLLFAQYFIDPRELKGEIQKNANLDDNWKEQLLQLVPPTKITSLEVNSIEEAVHLSNAATNTVINVLVDILTKYLIGGKDYQGELINRFGAFYNEIGPKVKSSSILIKMLKSIEDADVNVNFITPEPKDLVGAYLIENRSKFRVKDEEYSIQKKFFGPYYVKSNTEDFEINRFLDRLEDLVIKEKDGGETKLNLKKFNYWKLPQLFVDEDIIMEAIEVGMRRKLEMNLMTILREFGKELIDPVKQLRDDAIKGSLKEADVLNFSFRMPKFNFDRYDYGENIHDHNLDYVEKLRNFTSSFVEEKIAEIQSRLNNGNSISKEKKSLRKLYDGLTSGIEDLLEDYSSKIDVEISKLIEIISNFKREIKKEIYPNDGDILHYNLSYSNLVKPIDQLELEITNFLNEKYSEILFNEEQLRFILGVKLFDTISQSSFENTYDALVTNSLVPRMKEIKDTSKNILEFESNLRDLGRIQAYTLFNVFNELIEFCSSHYIKKDGIVSLDTDFLKLHLGKFKISRFPKKEVLTNLLNLPNIQVERDGDQWLISYGFTKLTRNEGNIPRVITLKDTCQYIHKIELIDELDDIFAALRDVGQLIEDDTFKRINGIRDEIFDVIFADN